MCFNILLSQYKQWLYVCDIIFAAPGFYILENQLVFTRLLCISTVYIVNSLFPLSSKHDKPIASLHDYNSL